MTPLERNEFYKKVGYATTEIFKKKYPKLCRVILLPSANGPVLKVHTLYGNKDSDAQLSIIDKFIKDYFNIETYSQLRLHTESCD